MSIGVRNVCVLGAGTMGCGIAAHLANLGFSVTILDISDDAVHAGFDKAKTARPPHFYQPGRAAEVRLGSTMRHAAWLQEADWVCEAVAERLDVKQALYTQIAPHLRPDALLTTNTSGLPIGELALAVPHPWRSGFCGTHFFNPPRHLKLVELIPGPETDPARLADVRHFLEADVARRVVPAKDTPGFIANRYGMWCMYLAIHVAQRLQLSVEQTDLITGPFLGRPKSGSFRLSDLVGLDVMNDIAQGLRQRLPDDPARANLETPSSMADLLAKGWIGEKAGQGYFRREGKELLAFDLRTHAYRQRVEARYPSIDRIAEKPLPERLTAALTLGDEVGEFARAFLVPALQYAHRIAPEIAFSYEDFDRVMRWGFGWELGPFEMIDAIGADRLAISASKFYENAGRRTFEGGLVLPPAEPEYRTLNEFATVDTDGEWRRIDLGDDLSALVSESPQGVVSPAAVEALISRLEGGLDRFILWGGDKNFSVGFDLRYLLDRIQAEDLDAVEQSLFRLQYAGELLESRRCVAALHGYSYGGGFELALGCPVAVAHPEAQIGFPEARVGLIPGGRGTVLMRLYNQSSAKWLAEVAMELTQGLTSGSADHARALGYLRPTDVTEYHPDRLLHRARRLLADRAEWPARPAWRAVEGPLVGMIDRRQNELAAQGVLSRYDEFIGDRIKAVIAKTTSYENARTAERAEFIELCRNRYTEARIRHMLEQRTPLRN
jgi:3-hydroxyacyl-CoA dehydrogenase